MLDAGFETETFFETETVFETWERAWQPTPVFLGFPGGLAGKESTCSTGDVGSIPGLGGSPEGGHGNPL